MSEVWTVEQAAAFWNVSPSRARALLARHRVPRGYDADAIREAPRPGQGARTDLGKSG